MRLVSRGGALGRRRPRQPASLPPLSPSLPLPLSPAILARRLSVMRTLFGITLLYIAAHAFQAPAAVPSASGGGQLQALPSVHIVPAFWDGRRRERLPQRLCMQMEPFQQQESGGAFGSEDITIHSGAAFIVGLDIKRDRYKTLAGDGDQGALWSITDSLDELERLCDTAGLEVRGRDYQSLQNPSASTFIGSGKVEELGELRLMTHPSSPARVHMLISNSNHGPPMRIFSR